jgi:hypothetical protein
LCAQVADINIALTAIGKLWSVADFLGSEETQAQAEGGGGGNGGGGGGGKSGQQDLWCVLLKELQLLSVDYRPEVR